MDLLGIFFTCLLWLGCIISGLVILLAVTLIIFAIKMSKEVDKILFGLRFMQWYTMNEIAAAGYSRFWCREILPILHKRKNLESRIRDDLGKPALEKAERMGFTSETIDLYEFRVIFNKRRKKKWKPSIWEFPVLKPAFS